MGWSGAFWRWCEAQGAYPPKAKPRHLQAYFAHQSTRLSAHSIAAISTSLRALYTWLDRPDLLPHLPRLRPQRVLPRVPLSIDQLSRLLAAARSERDRAMILVMATTGLRVSELRQLREIDLERMLLSVNGKGQKVRLLALDEPTLAAVRLLQERPLPHRRTIWRIVKQAGERAGIPHCYPHRLRVSFANTFLQEGGDLQALQQLLGHSSIITTAHYAGWSATERALAQQRRFSVSRRIAG